MKLICFKDIGNFIYGDVIYLTESTGGGDIIICDENDQYLFSYLNGELLPYGFLTVGEFREYEIDKILNI